MVRLLQARRIVPEQLVPYDWDARKGVLPQGFTFTRSGTRPYLGASGWASAATNEPRFDRQPGVPGLLIAGARTNKVTAAKSNPSATTNCTTSGDAGGVLSVVDDSAALGATWALFGPNVYKVDNSAGSTAFYVRFGGATGNTNAHSLSIISRGAGDCLLYDGTTETGVTALDGGSYARITGNSKTPANSSQQLAVKCAAGEIAYVVVPQLEAAAFADPTPIPGSTGSVTVNAETCSRSVVLPSGGFTGVVEFVTGPGISNQPTIYQTDGGAKVFQIYANTAPNLRLYLDTIANVDLGAIAPLTRYRMAFVWRPGANNLRGSVNVGAVAFGNGGSAVDNTTERFINQSFGHILRCNASPTRWRPPVSDAQLQALSALS